MGPMSSSTWSHDWKRYNDLSRCQWEPHVYRRERLPPRSRILAANSASNRRVCKFQASRGRTHSETAWTSENATPPRLECLLITIYVKFVRRAVFTRRFYSQLQTAVGARICDSLRILWIQRRRYGILQSQLFQVLRRFIVNLFLMRKDIFYLSSLQSFKFLSYC